MELGFCLCLHNARCGWTDGCTLRGPKVSLADTGVRHNKVIMPGGGEPSVFLPHISSQVRRCGGGVKLWPLVGCGGWVDGWVGE